MRDLLDINKKYKEKKKYPSESILLARPLARQVVLILIFVATRPEESDRTVMADTREAHTDCAPIPPDVAEVLQKGPRGPDGKGLRKVLEYFTSKDPHYVVETRPNKRAQGRELGRLTADWRVNFVI